MGFDLLNIQPHKVSKDLSGYITYIYGAPKTGKTTLATQMEKSLLLAFEPGYHALQGVLAVDITSWGDMRQIYRELKKDGVKKQYDAIIVDTIDIASDRCKKYICQQNGIDDLGELDFGKGWTKFKDEFNQVFRDLTQLGYAVFFIGHDKEVQVGEKPNVKTFIRPALSNSTRTIIAGMADIYGYSHQAGNEKMSVLTLRDPNGIIECGGRFKYLPNEIPMSYKNLTDALIEAIDKESAENNGEFVTNEKQSVPEIHEYNYHELMDEFNTLAGTLLNKNADYYSSLLITIVEKYLGKGKKVNGTTPEQAEFIYLINSEIKEDLMTE